MSPRVRALALVLLPVGFVLLEGTAEAGPNIGASIGLHVRYALPPGACAPPELVGTAGETSAEFPRPAYIYVYACNAVTTPGVGGLEFGLTYSGAYSPSGGGSPLNIFSWSLCADSEFPTADWPGPGSGNRILWTEPHCQNQPSVAGNPQSVIAVAGYFYVAAYAHNLFHLWKHPISDRVVIISCSGHEDSLYPPPDGGSGRLGAVAFSATGLGIGYNPCEGGYVIPTTATTWSTIKTIIVNP